MRLVLHIGMPKTGSSYLQHWLGSNKIALSEQDICFVDWMSSHRLAVEAYNDPDQDARSDVISLRDSCSFDDALAVLDAFRPTDKTVIASSEYFWECSAIRVAQIVGIAASTTIVCYLRRQDIVAASGYAQDVKERGRSDEVKGASYDARINYHRKLLDWNRAFSGADIQFRNYDRRSASRGLVSDFASVIGADVAKTRTEFGEKINESLSAEMTEIARLLNSKKTPCPPSALLAVQSALPFAPFGFSEGVTSDFERAYISSNRDLACHIPGEFEDFATVGWEPRGVDLTGRVPAERVSRVVAAVGALHRQPELLSVGPLLGKS